MDGSESQNHSGLMCAKWFVSARPFDVVGAPPNTSLPQLHHTYHFATQQPNSLCSGTLRWALISQSSRSSQD